MCLCDLFTLTVCSAVLTQSVACLYRKCVQQSVHQSTLSTRTIRLIHKFSVESIKNHNKAQATMSGRFTVEVRLPNLVCSGATRWPWYSTCNEVAKMRLLASPYLSVCPPVVMSKWNRRIAELIFLWNLSLCSFTKILQRILILFKI